MPPAKPYPKPCPLLAIRTLPACFAPLRKPAQKWPSHGTYQPRENVIFRGAIGRGYAKAGNVDALNIMDIVEHRAYRKTLFIINERVCVL